MRKRLLFIVGAILLLIAVTTFSHLYNVASAGEKAPPKIIDTAPVRGEELQAGTTPVTFYFDRAMDHPSVEKAFSVTPTIKGGFTWPNPSTLIFTPTEPWQRATEYVFVIARSATSAVSIPLVDDYALRLDTTGSLHVSQVLPADGTQNIDVTPLITVVFNRPVVPLLPVSDMAKLPSPITVVPPVDGAGQWINTSIYTFKPKQLQGGTSYAVTVNKGLTDVTGSVLTDDYTFAFSTLEPRVLEFFPENNATGILRDPQIKVTFSQPMDITATQAAFALAGPNGVSLPGKFTWDDKFYTLTFKPDELLDYGTAYTVNVDRTRARSQTNGLISKEVKAAFTTANAPDIVSTSPTDGQTAPPDGSFAIYFSAPMNLKDFAQRVTISPQPEGVKPVAESDDRNLVYKLSFGAEPSTSYSVTVDLAGLSDRYGTPIKLNPASKAYTIVGPNKVQMHYATSAYPPSASLKTGSNIGLYSAYKSETRVYTMHRNINSVTMALWSVPLKDFLRFSGGDAFQYRGDYQAGADNFIRRWTVPVFNPPNSMRYDLLTVSDRGTSVGQKDNVICIGAPPAHLDIGQKINVLKNDTTPFRLRDKAGMDSVIIGQVQPGIQFNVVDGPICADKFIWWKLQSDDQTVSGWGAEGDLTKYFIGPVNSSDTGKPPAAAQQDSRLKAGVYWLDFTSADLPDNSQKLTHLMVVATANITLKVTPKDALVWVTDLQTAKPISNVNVQLYTGRDAAPMEKPVKTDADGLARFTLPDVATIVSDGVFAVVDDGGNFGVGASSWSNGIAPGDFDQPTDFQPAPDSVYIYTDRVLYRPGQPVYYRGVLRHRDDATYTLGAQKNVGVEVYDGNGNQIFKKQVALNEFGTFSDSFDISDKGAIGDWKILVRANPNDNGFVHQFSVADYRLPEYQVKLTADKSQVVQGGRIHVTLDSSYFFGGAVSNASVKWAVRADPYYFSADGYSSYNFTDYNEDSGPSAQPDYNHDIDEGVGLTDARGQFTISLPAILPKSAQSQTFTIEAGVTDESNQQVAGSAQVIVHAGDYYIGATAEEYVGTAKQPQNIDLVTVDWNGKPSPSQDLSVRAVERVWNSVQTIEPGTGRVVWESNVTERPIDSAVVHTGDNGKVVYTFTPPQGGIYKIYVTSRDSHGNQVTTSTFLWVTGENYVSWRQQNSNRIDLKIDHDSYKVGDTAKILIASPFQGPTTALITVERGKILKSIVTTFSANSTVYDLPITDDMAPNAFVSVVLVKGVTATNPSPAFRIGMIQLAVNPERLSLKINVSTDKPSAGPRDTVTYKFHVTNYMGEPVRAELGLALVDLANLSLMPDTNPTLLEHFYGHKSLSVLTASALVLSVDQQTEQILNTIKGGGGGGEEQGILQVRQQFVDTPLWNPSVITDNNGDASINVTLPDNLTTWRLDVRGVTQPTDTLKTTLVGQTTHDLISSKPLLIRPLTSRFYVVGDTSTLAAIVNNNTNQPIPVTVNAAITGAKVNAPAQQTATIPALGRQRFDWPVEVQDTDKIGATFSVISSDRKYSDAAKSDVGQGTDKTLPVEHFEAPDTVGTSGVIDKQGGDRVEGVSLPQRLQANNGTLTIRVENSLASSTTTALNVLQNYPYECIEQTISRFLPNVMTYRALKELNLDNSKMHDNLATVIKNAVQRLYNEQHGDGGWGWFVQEDSNSVVTAYALLGLYEARSQGFDIDPNVIQNAVRSLQQKLVDLKNLPEMWMLNRQAFVLYVLAHVSSGDQSRTVSLFNLRDNLSIYGRAYLALAFAELDPSDHFHIDPLITDLVNHEKISATGVHWEEGYDDYPNMNTDVRTTAIVLKTLVKIQPDNAQLPDVVRWLMLARKTDAWETTQETAWSVMALTDWMKHTDDLTPNYTYNVQLNDTSLANNTAVTADSARQANQWKIAIADLLKGEGNRITFERTAGAGNLYYTSHLTVYMPIDQIKAESRGISISRVYSLATDKDHKPITSAHVGDNIRVSLTIIAPRDLNYVQIIDPIPAGTEAVDPQLPTQRTIGDLPDLALNNPLSQGWGWWWFSRAEVHDDSMILYASYLPRGTYQFTYTLRTGMVGQYHVIPTQGQEFYFPDIYGRSDGTMFTLLPYVAPDTSF